MIVDIDGLREARLDDVDALSELKLSTFRETFLQGFAIPYPPDDLARFEEEMYAPGRIGAELLDRAHRTWVVERNERLIAYAHVGPCKLPHPDVKAEDVELYQMYIRTEAQGSGLGKAMLDFILNPGPGVMSAPKWLGVWSGNERAKRVYQSRGFVKAGEYRFRVGNWFDEEYIYRRP